MANPRWQWNACGLLLIAACAAGPTGLEQAAAPSAAESAAPAQVDSAVAVNVSVQAEESGAAPVDDVGASARHESRPPHGLRDGKSPHGPRRAAVGDVLSTTDRQVGGTKLTVAFHVDDLGLSHDEIADWIASCAQVVADYYGAFPVPDLKVEVVKARRSGIGFGQAFAGRRIRLHIGQNTSPADLRDDWVLVHEMLHMGFPFLHERHGWMREGLSTYVEPIVRARAGWVTDEQVWARWLERMPYGLPAAGDRGFDRTKSWGNTYWGGALFWLLLDIDLRRQTGNRQSVEPLLRHVVAAGGNARVTWPIERVCKRADAGTKTQSFTTLYKQVADQPIAVDLDQLWRDLGVSQQRGAIVFNEDAPLAHIRRAITRAS